MLFQHEVVSNTKLNDKFNLIQFKSKNGEFKFKLGQFTTMKINSKVFRCYSFASTPEELPYWNIFVDITPGGPGTAYLKFLRPGQIIETLSIGGQFKINKKLKKYIFGATGCGVAPFLPMIKKLNEDKNSEIYFFWGLRTEKDIVLIDTLKMYSKLNNKFHFEIVLSKPTSNWKGEKGHITDKIIDMVKKASHKNMGIYLSGSNKFIDDILKLLTNQKFPSEKIYHEACY